MALCASMQLQRESNEVWPVPTERQRHTAEQNGSPIPPSISPIPDIDKLEDQDDLAFPQPDWDELLYEVRLVARKMHQTRKCRMGGRKNAAGWARWAVRRKVEERGEFVETDDELEFVSEVDGRKWIIVGGYRRNTAVAATAAIDVIDDSDPDTDGEGYVTAEKDGQDGGSSSEPSGGVGSDVEMAD